MDEDTRQALRFLYALFEHHNSKGEMWAKDSISDVIDLIESANPPIPAGSVVSEFAEFTIEAWDRLRVPWVPTHAISIFEAGTWVHNGRTYDAAELNDAAFIRYRDTAIAARAL